MSSDRLLTILALALLATSIGSSLAALHFYQLGLEQVPQVLGFDSEIGWVETDLFQDGDEAFDLESLVAQLLGSNSTQPQAT
jgi:hypothetical protein